MKTTGWAVLAVLIPLGAALYWPVFDIPPFEEDNVYALAWVEAAPARALLTVDPTYYPEWRPLAYAALWLENRFVRLGPVAVHFAVNLALWIACAWLVYRMVDLLAPSRMAAPLAAGLVLTEPRATWALVSLIERQSSMACVLGLGAFLIVLRADPGGLGRLKAVAVASLLLASALSKEYGLAFALAMAGSALMRKRADLARPALAAGALYVALRWIMAGGATAPYCEQMYFFSSVRDVCIDPLQPDSFPQMAYNVAATLVNLPLLGFLSGVGEPIFAEYRLAMGTVMLILAGMAVARGPALVRMIALVPVANALLSFMIYRDRNQLAGACALAMLAGIGLPHALALLRHRTSRVAAVAAIAALLGAQALLAHALVVEERSNARTIEPCESEIRDRPFVPPFIARAKTRYGMPDPACRRTY